MRFTATASRGLSFASVDGHPQSPQGAAIQTSLQNVESLNKIEFQWRDEFDLAGKEPFTLTVTACDDEAPALDCEDLPRSKVVLDSEQLNFRVKAEDDFGVKRVGMEWEGIEASTATAHAKGEHIIAAGGPDKRSMEAVGTFSAQSLGIEAQPIHLRVYAEDYFPGRKRTYSPNYALYVLTPEQHAIWITEQLSKWHRQSLEVRDREMQLHDANKQIRNLSPGELDRPAVRRKIDNQAAAERANGRRLTALTAAGEDLLRQASRNPQFDVNALNRWAEMMQILKDISANRMPSVADLLKEAAKADAAKASAGNQQSATGPKAGKSQAGGGKPSSTDPNAKKNDKPPMPKVADSEPSLEPPKKNDDDSKAPPKKPSAGSLRLPTTTLMGQGGDDPKNPPSPAGNKMDEAVRKQQDLLVEFEKVVNELNNVLGTLEGKDAGEALKAASREQYRVSGRMGDLLDDSFGKDETHVGEANKPVFVELAAAEKHQQSGRLHDHG